MVVEKIRGDVYSVGETKVETVAKTGVKGHTIVEGAMHLNCRTILVHAIVFSLTLAGVGCVLFLAKETRYLLSATGRATQEEVRQHLGEPLRVTSNKAGEGVWVYRVRERVEGGNNAWTMVGVWWCDDY